MNSSKVLLFVIWIVGIIIFTFFIWRMLFQAGKPINVPPKEGNIIFFGDSLVEGQGASPGNDLPSLLSKKIDEPVLNAGKGGDTTGSALNRLEQDVLSQNPRLVIILLGGNDILRQIPPDEVYKNLSIIIDKIKARGSAVLLLGVRGGLFGDPYKDVFETLAKEKQIDYIPDILNGIIGRADLMSDPIHPNDRGYAKIADRIEPAVHEILTRK